MSSPNDRQEATDFDSPFAIGCGSRSEPVAEKIVLRSYDHQHSYELTVSVDRTDGRSVFEKRYTLVPGTMESVIGAVPPGEYVISASLDGSISRSVEVTLDESPAGTAVVEVGNGTLSLTEGL